ncbi:MAG: glycosyltransferase family 10 [Chitinophagaceae bacterium]|nr:glycosyltransferase family 10 [Chitinophagaceae bacterium]
MNNLCLKKDINAIAKQKTKFACMVVSNGACKERNQFFEMLNRYKKVDSGGKYLNNVGGPVKDKVEFIKEYKFVLAFENSSYPGYTTEKIVEPMLVNSLPIYWGNPVINRDFNPKSFVNIHDYNSFDDAIETIIQIDKDEELYRKYLSEPFFEGNIFPADMEFGYFQDKLVEIVNLILNQMPVSSKFFYMPAARFNKLRRKLLSRIYHRPHFRF